MKFLAYFKVVIDSGPDTVLDTSDKGDETLKRFRFQITYAAIISLSLLDDTSQVEEIFCEHHEDILVKRKDGKFIGVQVKTRDLKLGAFGTTDEPIFSSIKKFCCLEKKFPEIFIRYTIVSNTGFYGSDNSYKNLQYVIQLAKDNKTDELLKKRSKLKPIIIKLANDSNCSENEVIAVLSKIELKGDAAGLKHVFLDLNDRLSRIDSLKGHTTGVISQVAQKLVGIHFNASSLSHTGSITEEYILETDVNEGKTKKIIEGKKIRKEILLSAIKECFNEPISLLTQGTSSFDELPKGNDRLVLKMDKGNISYDNVNLQKDNKYASETHFASWIHKHGNDKARKQYEQVKLIVQNECQSAYDESFDETKEFGTIMLRDVRKRIKNRIASDRNSFFDCKEEHLLGMSAILTEDCKVWWSKKFDFEK